MDLVRVHFKLGTLLSVLYGYVGLLIIPLENILLFPNY